MTAPVPEPLYLALDPFPAFGVLHAAAEPRQDVAVLLLPPFGWEEMNSHRPLRAWAEHLAAGGITTLRLDLPGTADSAGGPHEAGLPEAWTGAVDEAAHWLRAHTGSRRTAALGIGLGGFVACRAVAGGAPLDHLVLWGVPARGRTLVRELRAFARLEASRLSGEGAPAPPALPDGAIAAAGYLMSAETRRALDAVEVETLAAPDGTAPSVLLLGRDGVGADEELRDRAQASGATITMSEGRGYGEMVLGDMEAFRVPTATFAAVSAWLRAGDPASAHAPGTANGRAAVAAGPSAQLSTGEGPIRETALALDVPGISLPGVLTEPAGARAPLCAVFLDAGSQRRTGPSRMWVDIARRWAARGVPSVRFDVAGIGDADGVSLGWGDSSAFYDGRHAAQVRAALDVLADRGLPPRFLLVGLCSGANWAFHAALEDERVAGTVLLNPGALFWNRWTSLALGGRQVRRLAVITTWGRLRAREIGIGPALRTALSALVPGRVVARLRAVRRRLRWLPGAPDRLAGALERLAATGCRVDLAFTEREPLRTELEVSGGMAQLAAHPQVDLELIASGAQTHTMQPLWIQERAQALVDRAFARELARAGVQSETPTGPPRPSIPRARDSA